MSDFERIDKYVVVGKIGQGSFGVVYKGRDPYLKRPVAIKICSVDDEDLRRRFLREAEISGKLQHKNIVTVFAFGFEREVPYLAQEFLTGEDLDEVIKRRTRLAPSQRLDLLRQVASGLAYAHRQGVIHRDIKPSNVRVLEDGQVKIMDFGIAKLANAETQLTQKGVTMGTASYLPPEQVRGGKLDHRADIFSFGVLAYELLTYERPFKGNTLSALVYQILYKVPLPMTAVWEPCPRELSDLVSRCLDKKPDNRYASFDQVIEELDKIHESLEAGKWPELLAETSSLPAVEEAEDSGGDEPPEEPMAPETITEAAETVIAGHGLVAPGLDPGVTQPVAIPDLGSLQQAQDSEVDDGSLIDQGEAIGSLVAEGRLEEAMKRLEETVILQREGSQIITPGSPGDQAVTSVAPAGGDDLAATLQMEAVREPAQPAAGERAEPSKAADKGAERSKKRSKDRNRKDRGHDQTATVATATLDGTDKSPTDTYRTAIRLPPATLKWVGLAVGMVLGLILLGRGRKEPAPRPAPEPVQAVATAVPSKDPDLGRVRLNVLPWAELTEITDQDGFVQDLPSERRTPLSVELPPGSYVFTLRNAAFPEDEIICPVTVDAGGVADCQEQLAESTVTDYFKQAGWWQ